MEIDKQMGRRYTKINREIFMEKWKRQIPRIVLGCFNVVILCFIIVYAIVRRAGTASNVMAILMIATIGADILYGAFTNTKFGLIQIGAVTLLVTVNTFANLIVGLSVFELSISFVGTIALGLIPAETIALLIYEMRKGMEREKTIACANQGEAVALGLIPAGKSLRMSERNWYRILLKLLTCVALILSVALLVIGYDCVNGSGVSQINSNTSFLGVYLIFLAIASFSLFLRTARECGVRLGQKLKNTPPVALIAVVAVLAITELGITEGSAFHDAQGAEASFRATAFGSSEWESAEDMRPIPYSIADEFFGVATDGYEITRDIVYYQSEQGQDKGLRLAYDVYCPTQATAHKSVLVCIHGSGGDKDLGNFAHRNKYFASRGYVVYDIQIGDYNEKDTNFGWHMERSSQSMLEYIDRFFAYAASHNEYGADFGNAFLEGVSMGGSLTLKYALTYPNTLTASGVTLKGIIPVYPGFWAADTGIDDFLSAIDENSIPCLYVMGNRDGVVTPNSFFYVQQKYWEKGNPNFAGVLISYAGHGFDSAMAGRGNQLLTYYAERFMSTLRSR